MPRKSEQEWALIENEYINMPVTYGDLSKKYNVSPTAIGTKAILRGWEAKRNRFLRHACEKSQEQQIKAKQKENFNLINQLEKLIKIKTQAELDALLKYYKLTDDGKSVSPIELMKLINKSKDSTSELIKITELLKGNATDRVDFRDDEKENDARKKRMDILGFN